MPGMTRRHALPQVCLPAGLAYERLSTAPLLLPLPLPLPLLLLHAGSCRSAYVGMRPRSATLPLNVGASASGIHSRLVGDSSPSQPSTTRAE